MGVYSNYVRVRYEIEFPDSLEYFKWIQGFVEDSQVKTPILIKEQAEKKEHSPFELQEIPISKDVIKKVDSGFEQKYVEPIITGLKEGTKLFSESIIDCYRSELTKWEREFNIGTVQTTKKIQDSLKQMGLTISDGLNKVEAFVDKTFKKRINEFNNEIFSLVNQRVKKNMDLKTNISNNKETLINNVISRVDENITEIYENLKRGLNMVTNQIGEIHEENVKFETNILKLNDFITKISNQINSSVETINKNIEAITQPFESNLIDKYEKIISEIEPLMNNHSEIKDLIDKLQKTISGLRNMKK